MIGVPCCVFASANCTPCVSPRRGSNYSINSQPCGMRRTVIIGVYMRVMFNRERLPICCSKSSLLPIQKDKRMEITHQRTAVRLQHTANLAHRLASKPLEMSQRQTAQHHINRLRSQRNFFRTRKRPQSHAVLPEHRHTVIKPNRS